MTDIKSILTFSDIILYWHITEQINANETYYIYADGALIGVTDKTHFTLRDVKNKNVNIEIFTDELKEQAFYKASFTLPQKPRFIDVTAAPYFAVGDGKTLNTSALQRAIDDCGDGECVYFPKGVYLTGALDLHSNMQLYISEGAELRGSTEPTNYLPYIWSRFEGNEMECYRSLLNLGNIRDRDSIVCENVLIYGGGKIIGGGKALSENVIAAERKIVETDPTVVYDTSYGLDLIVGRKRPKLLNISCSENVVMDNIGFENGSCWNIHILYSKQVVTCNSRFHSFGVHNGDGWDPDSSEDCSIFNCDFCTGDDCVAIKSGKNPEGNVIAKPCRRINVFDCRVEYGHGLAIGSEMSGGVSDVYIWDCDLGGTICGFEIKGTQKRGGYVKNIFVDRCRISRIAIHSVPYNDDGEPAPEMPYFKDCSFRDVTLTGEAYEYGTRILKPCSPIDICGFDEEHKVENILLKNVTVYNGKYSVKQLLTMQFTKEITISNLCVK